MDTLFCLLWTEVKSCPNLLSLLLSCLLGSHMLWGKAEIFVKSVTQSGFPTLVLFPLGSFVYSPETRAPLSVFLWSKQQQVFAKLLFIPNTWLHNSGLSLGQNLGEREGI